MRTSSVSSLVSSFAFSSLALLAACSSSNSTVDAATEDAGAGGDGSTGSTTCPEPMCCFRVSQAANQDAPELRIRFIDVQQPANSPLAQTIVETVLNQAFERETFNWLVRFTGAASDGPIEIMTGFGIRNADGSFTFDTGMYAPAVIPGTIANNVVNSDVYPGPLVVPVYDTAGTMLQIEFPLRDLSIHDQTLTAERSCVGRRQGRSFVPGAELRGYVSVEDAMGRMINVPPVTATLCDVLAGEISTPMGETSYCVRTPRTSWAAPPDSLCDTTGCSENAEGMTDVCDPATTCNAWHLVAQFAANGVEIND